MQRVSNVMTQQSMIASMHSNLAKLMEYQSQLATGKKYTSPSDNPIDVVRQLSLKTNLAENEQYIRNQDDAITWLSNTDTALQQMTDIVDRVRELTIYAGNGSLGEDETAAIAAELGELQEELRNVANYSVEGRYLFSGLSTGELPFVRDADGNVAYMGNDGKVRYEVEQGVVGEVSFSGSEIFPEDYVSNTLTSVELPIDFEWTGRNEILQITVGSRTVKVRLSEDWTDANVNGTDDVTDYNQFRDDGEVEGLTLDEISQLINESLDMGDVSKLISASVVKDESAGVQRLVLESHTGEPILVTGWQETDSIDESQSILGLDASSWTAGDGTVRVLFQAGEDVTFDIDATDTLSTIAEKLTSVPGVSARVSADGGSLVATATNKGTQFNLELTGAARELFSTSMDETVTVTSVEAVRSTDQSHIDFASLMGMETALKSREFSDGELIAIGDDLHLRFESGGNYAELKINGGDSLTIDELAERIRQVAGDWLEVVVQDDATESGLGTPESLEELTKRLILRPVDNEPLVVFDKNSAGYALDLGFSTATQSSGGTVVFPSIPCVDENMAALVQVSVGGENFQVKIYPDDVRATGSTAIDQTKVMQQIVEQVNAAAGENVLGYTVLDSATGECSLYAKNGESLRIVDLPISDPSFSPSYTMGIAMQMGISSGITSEPVADSATATAGTMRIESLGRSVDIDISAGDTPKIIADKIRDAAEGWLDVSYFDPEVPAAGSLSQLNIAAKDGSPVSIYDVQGDNASSVLRMDNAIRGDVDVSGWTLDADPTQNILSISVDGYTHTVDLNAIYDSNESGTIDIEDVTAAINARFQGMDVKARLVDDGVTGEQYLILTSPRGYSVKASGTAQAPLLGTSATITSRGNSSGDRYTQNMVTRTSSDSQKTNFFGVLDNLTNAVTAEDREGLSNIMLGKIDDFIDNLLQCRTTGGALLKRYENNQARFEQNNTYITELYGKVAEIDFAEISTEYAMAQSIYEASLAVIAQIVQPTLVDFLS